MDRRSYDKSVVASQYNIPKCFELNLEFQLKLNSNWNWIWLIWDWLYFKQYCSCRRIELFEAHNDSSRKNLINEWKYCICTGFCVSYHRRWRHCALERVCASGECRVEPRGTESGHECALRRRRRAVVCSWGVCHVGGVWRGAAQAWGESCLCFTQHQKILILFFFFSKQNLIVRLKVLLDVQLSRWDNFLNFFHIYVVIREIFFWVWRKEKKQNQSTKNVKQNEANKHKY